MDLLEILGKEGENITVENGLSYALKVCNELSRVDGLKNKDIMVTSIQGQGTSGLFIQNSMTLKGVRITSNVVAGCGRAYFGDSNTLPYPDRTPIDILEPYDFESYEIKEIVDKIVTYLSEDDLSSLNEFLNRKTDKDEE